LLSPEPIRAGAIQRLEEEDVDLTRERDHLDPLRVIFGDSPVIAQPAAETAMSEQPDGVIPRDAILFGDLPQAPPGQRPADKVALDQHLRDLDQLPETAS
jgi:hypothetical protein